MSNTMAHINPFTTENFYSAAKQTTKSTLPDLKQRKTSLVPILSDAPTVRASIKQTLPIAHSGNIISIKSIIAKNMLNFAKTTRNQFVYL